MCGILGIAGAVPLPHHWPIAIMRDQMQHRGPDDAGLWWSDDHRVVLAHRRLAIIDLSPRGHQPMHHQRLRLHLVFNGEIYNFRELRSRLESLGHVFQSHSDTEVLLAAYATWGKQCLDHLRGMYAFAIYDERQNRLFAARDRAGEKPFFYWHHGSTLWFASELKALFAHPDFPRQLHPEALEYYLAYGYVPGDLCIVQGVHKLPPAHALEYDLARNTLYVWPYWSLPRGEGKKFHDEQELVEKFDKLLEVSVRQQLVADVPVGILLSGGVDSSLVAAVAARCSAGPVRTFTITFPGHGAFDESPYARRVAEHLGTQHTELAAEPGTVELLPKLAAQYDEPIADSSMLPTFMVCQLIRRHATVALGGDGGDELFGGYPHHSFLLRIRHLSPFIPRRLLQCARMVCRKIVPPGVRGRNALLALLSEPNLRLAQMNAYFDAGFRDYLLRPLRKSYAPPDCEAWKQKIAQCFATDVQRITAVDFLTYLPDDILVKVDRASMLASLEVRAPFLDKDIVEFAFAEVPDHLRVTSKQRKILPRKLAARLLPADLDTTRKQGFSIPLDDWFRGSWGPTIKDILYSAPQDLFCPRAIRRLIRRQERGWSNAHRLFALAIFEMWRRHYHITW